MIQMKQNWQDWLVPIHCVNNKMELAIKDAFDKSGFDEIDKLYLGIYNLCKNSGPIKTDTRIFMYESRFFSWASIFLTYYQKLGCDFHSNFYLIIFFNCYLAWFIINYKHHFLTYALSRVSNSMFPFSTLSMFTERMVLTLIMKRKDYQ